MPWHDNIYEDYQKNIFIKSDWQYDYLDLQSILILDCANDACCYPANHPDRPCTLKPRAQCSPSEGPCCTPECKIVPEHQGQVCQEDRECSYPAKCDGHSAKCPIASPKEDSIPCEDESKVGALIAES